MNNTGPLLALVFLILLPLFGVTESPDSTPHNAPARQQDTSNNDASDKHISDKGTGQAEQPGLGSIIGWRFKRLWNKEIRHQAALVRQTRPEPQIVELQPLGQREAELVWLGHSTVLVRHGDSTILTDPHLGDQASPVSWAGPERVTPPAMTADELPFIDFVVISHNHYDHLDLPTLENLARRTGPEGQKTLFLAPEGLAGWLKKKGIENALELAWWESRKLQGWEITATPVQHHSGRGMFDKDKTRWAGWSFKQGEFGFFFAGDTGYSSVFAQIGKRLGPFSLAAIPIGGYEPRSLMHFAHVNPEEAVKIHQDIGAQRSVGIHWGTFLGLTDEPFNEPPARLASAAEAAGLSDGDFNALAVGGQLQITTN